jgi:signal transduction histidine kinase
MKKKATRKSLIPSLPVNIFWMWGGVLLALIAISWHLSARHLSDYATQPSAVQDVNRFLYTVVVNRHSADPAPGTVVLEASDISGGGRLELLRQSSSGAMSQVDSLGRYPLLTTTDKRGLAEMVFSSVALLLGEFTYLLVTLVAVALWLRSKIDERTLQIQLKSRQSRIFLAIYCLTIVAVVNWHASFKSIQLLGYGFFSTVVIVYIYRYTASGVASLRPKIFLWSSMVIACVFLILSETFGIREVSVSVLFVATTLWLCELVTRGQYRNKDGRQALSKYDWRAIFWGCFLLLAWRDLVSMQYIDVRVYQELSVLSRVILIPALWFPLMLTPMLVFLLRSLVVQHQEKLATLDIYNEKLLKSIQERDLQINLSYYDDLQRQEKEAIEAERQNIYRDLHDGIGSRLVAAMYSLRSGKTTKAALENALLSCLTDIKRIMHADDLQDHRSIQDLFFDYCFTMDDLLSESGVTFEYKIPSEQEFYMLGKASGTLIKMSQEIVTNALKHSPARSLFVELQLSDADLSILVREFNYDFESTDAFGQAKTISSGAGLANLKLRALEIGAEFHYEQRSDERKSRIDMRLFDPDLVYLPDKVHFDPERRRQFLISKIGDLS